jgi:LuxR family transcriptional regulator, quorum-sensing system regulator CviR
MDQYRQEGDDARMMEIIVQCAAVHTAEQFSTVIKGPLRDMLPHEVMVCGLGGVTPQGQFMHKMLNHDYPVQYFADMQDRDGKMEGPLLKRWRETLEPVLFQSGRDDAGYPQDWITIFNRYNLRNTIGHGLMDFGGTFTSYFIFSRIPGEVGPRHAFLIKLLVPHLHFTLTRIMPTIEDYEKAPAKVHKPLSERQREILYWMHERKTNWEIATILELSELNVKYHIEQIFAKLDVRNRAHAVAKAHQLGLLLPPRN